MYFYYQTEICTWFIRPHSGGWLLLWGVGSEIEISGRYRTPREATSDVALGQTGLDEWDDLPDIPLEIEDIHGWEVAS